LRDTRGLATLNLLPGGGERGERSGGMKSSLPWKKGRKRKYACRYQKRREEGGEECSSSKLYKDSPGKRKGGQGACSSVVTKDEQGKRKKRKGKQANAPGCGPLTERRKKEEKVSFFPFLQREKKKKEKG